MKQIKDSMIKNQKESNESYSGKVKKIELNGDIIDSELEIISNCIKNSGLILITNFEYANEETFKSIFNLIETNNNNLHKTFRIVFLTNSKNLNVNHILFEKCLVLNNYKKYIEEYNFKTNLSYIIRIIPTEIIEFYNMNIYLKKILVNFIIIHTIFIQISQFNEEFLGKIENKLGPFDLIELFNFLKNILENNDLNNVYSQIDNDLNFNYMNLIYIAIDLFYLSRVIDKNKCKLLKNIILRFFDEEIFFNENKILVNYCINNSNNHHNLHNNVYKSIFYNEKDFIIKFENFNENLNQLLLNELLIKNIANNEYYNIISEITNNSNIEFFLNNNLFDIYKNLNIINNHITPEMLKENSSLIKQDLHVKKILSKIQIKKVYNIIFQIKNNFPEFINYSEGFYNQSLFKLNKQGNFSNPMDEILLYEIKNLNNKLQKLNEEIFNILNVIKGEMRILKPYDSIINDLNNEIIPKEWLKIIYDNYDVNNKNEKEEEINDFLIILKERIDYYQKWLDSGINEIYNLKYFSNVKLLFNYFKIYFCRCENKHLNDKKFTPEQIELVFNLNKNSIKNYKENFKIEGLELINAELIKDENDNYYINDLNKGNKSIDLPQIILGYKIIQFNNNNNENKKNSVNSINNNNNNKNSNNEPILKEENFNENNYCDNNIENNVNNFKEIEIFNKEIENLLFEKESLGKIKIEYFNKENITEEHKENMEMKGIKIYVKNK